MATNSSINSSAGSSTHQGSFENDDLEADTFLERLISVVALDDVEKTNQTQKNMLNRFEKTNEMLVNCNALGQIHFEKLSKDYRKHTAKLVEMHKDLDWIFHRVRFLKQKLIQKYPDLESDGNKSNLVDDNKEEKTDKSDQLAPNTTEESQPEEPKILSDPETEPSQPKTPLP